MLRPARTIIVFALVLTAPVALSVETPSSSDPPMGVHRGLNATLELDGDGRTDLVFTRYPAEGPVMEGWRSDGALLWEVAPPGGFPTRFAGVGPLPDDTYAVCTLAVAGMYEAVRLACLRGETAEERWALAIPGADHDTGDHMWFLASLGDTSIVAWFKEYVSDLAGSGVRTRVYVYDVATGEERFSRVFPLAGDVPRLLLPGDLDGDGEADILYVERGARDCMCVPTPATTRVSALTADGDVIGSGVVHPAAFCGATARWPFPCSDPYVGDLDGDGLPDLLLVSGESPRLSWVPGTSPRDVLAIQGSTGKLLWSRPLTAEPNRVTLVGDVDGLPGTEILFVDDRGALEWWSGKTGATHQIVVSSERWRGGNPPTDADGDGVLDLLVHAGGWDLTHDWRTSALLSGRNGSAIWTHRVEWLSSTPPPRELIPGVRWFGGDFDGDGGADILDHTTERTRALDGASGEILWEVPASGYLWPVPVHGSFDVGDSDDILLASAADRNDPKDWMAFTGEGRSLWSIPAP